MIRRRLSVVLMIGCLAVAGGSAAAREGTEEPPVGDTRLPAPDIPDVEVVDQDGRRLRFYSDLVKGRVVAIQFVFTTCTTICRPLSAVFKQVQDTPGAPDVELISISVDPTTDTPARLKVHAEQFGVRPGWTLVTGAKTNIDTLLRALGAYTGDKASHTPFILIGNDRTAQWRRTYGLAPAEKILATIRGLAGAAERAYFTNLPLIDHQGREVLFYDDVLEGKIVVVHFMFTRCQGICPILGNTMRDVQRRLSDVVGKDVRLVSISVDPEHDTPATLGEFARRFEAGAGWLFLTGEKQNVDRVSYKLGGYTEQKEAHLPLFLVGDVVTGRWTKVVGAAEPERIAAVVRSLLAARTAASGA